MHVNFPFYNKEEMFSRNRMFSKEFILHEIYIFSNELNVLISLQWFLIYRAPITIWIFIEKKMDWKPANLRLNKLWNSSFLVKTEKWNKSFWCRKVTLCNQICYPTYCLEIFLSAKKGLALPLSFVPILSLNYFFL